MIITIPDNITTATPKLIANFSSQQEKVSALFSELDNITKELSLTFTYSKEISLLDIKAKNFFVDIYFKQQVLNLFNLRCRPIKSQNHFEFFLKDANSLPLLNNHIDLENFSKELNKLIKIANKISDTKNRPIKEKAMFIIDFFQNKGLVFSPKDIKLFDDSYELLFINIEKDDISLENFGKNKRFIPMKKPNCKNKSKLQIIQEFKELNSKYSEMFELNNERAFVFNGDNNSNIVDVSFSFFKIPILEMYEKISFQKNLSNF